MTQLVLHHYPNSPFAEKIRTILGYKGLTWTSVIIPVVLPKPDVVALTGGYRKTPILQIGADIYCDTALIADHLERLCPLPTLYPFSSNGLDRLLAQWADATLFWAAIAYTLQPAGAAHIFAGMSEASVKAFVADRAAFRANVARVRPADALSSLTLYLGRLESMLLGGDRWLLGPDPSIADFSVYHCLWFVYRGGPVADILKGYPRLVEWWQRMRRIGHAQHDELDSGGAVELARSRTPQISSEEFMLEPYGLARGTEVEIAATDYGCDTVRGELVLSTPTEIAVRRFDERAGEVVVHFPRLGFALKKA